MQPSAPTRETVQFGPITVDYDARVLAPRPWTLAQSAWAAELVRDQRAGCNTGRILELCAGAGHIGLAAAVLSDRDLVQVELDSVAATFAADNARRAGWAERVEIRVASLEDSLQAGEWFPLMIADPPYLASSATARWPDDPVRAIDGGADGLDLIRACLRLAAAHLSQQGSVLLQVAGPDQAAQTARMVQRNATSRLAVREVRVVDAERAVMRIDRQ